MAMTVVMAMVMDRPSLEKLEQLLAAPREPLLFCPDFPTQAFKARFDVDAGIEGDLNGITDLLSQINVLQQLENITTHNFLKPAIESQNLILHALWYHIETGSLPLPFLPLSLCHCPSPSLTWTMQGTCTCSRSGASTLSRSHPRSWRPSWRTNCASVDESINECSL